jgi:acyl-CoA synthetase (AMP-forming)/AMP-acid ligase II
MSEVRFDVPSVLLPDILEGHARRTPGKSALVCEDATLTYAEFDAAVAGFARWLLARGIGRSERVAILGEPTSQTIVALHGVLRAGACVASLSGMASAASLARMLEDSGAKVLIVDDAFAPRIAEALAEGAALPPLSLRIGSDAPGWLSFASALAEGRDLPKAPWPRIDPEDDLVILYSSGTTGVPKGIVLSHRGRLANCWMMAVEMKAGPDAVVFSGTAFYSNTTWTLLNLAFFVGGTAVPMRRFEPQRALQLLVEHRVSHTVLVPAILRMILDAEEGRPADLSAIRAICSVGSALPLPLKQKLVARFPDAFCEIYGLTEGLILFLSPQDAASHIGSVGKAMIAYDIRIVGDDDRELPPGEKGEIVGYGPMLMRGYNRRPDATAECIWREPDSGRTFLRSGDIGYLDADGFLYLVDRKKDMLVSGGYNVYPADIERVAGQNEAVLEAAVVGVPHEKWGETPCAYIVPAPGAASIDAPALREWINARVGKHERVSHIVVVDSLPRNAGGKILKRELRDAFAPPPGGAA